MKIHTTPRSGGEKKQMKASMDLQTENKTYSEETKLITALFLVPGP